jgi:hypothetical protein
MASNVQIIPFYAHPHVHTVIIDNTWYDETVAQPIDPDDLPYSTMVVTGADTGIDNTFVKLTSARTKVSLFGKGNYQKYGQSSLQADRLFNGQTAVWFMRVLPDNATYANTVVLAHYRKGNILDELNQETDKVRMEVKFSVAYAAKPYLTEGAMSDEDIEEFANSLASLTPHPTTGYMTIPLFYVRSIGRGQYGNHYSLRLARDNEAEREYGMKMYRYSLLANNVRILNHFAGSMYQTQRYEMSTLIDDVLDQFATGSSPIYVKTFQDNFIKLYDFYKEIVAENAITVANPAYEATPEDMAELRFAANLTEDTFDPVFGFKLNTRTSELVPYYRNYTVREPVWVPPNLTIPDTVGSVKPLNVADWNTAFAGARVLVIADPLNDGKRWLYTVLSVDQDTGNIEYNAGTQTDIDADQYDGINLALPVGQRLDGGHDGDFQEINIGGDTRPPSEAEMKLLLSKEYVRAFRGQKDRKILSPARVNVDFIFDANYNMTANEDENLLLDTTTMPLYSTSTVLTDKDFNQLMIVGSSPFLADLQDLNVKKAMYDLNEFRNKNGMTVDHLEGAGCLLHLDCNLTGVKIINSNAQLSDIITMMEEFDGRNTAIDLGYYEIYDPVTTKRIRVTATYFVAQNLVPHIMRFGLNKPFVYNFATLNAIQRNSRTQAVTGNMIRDTFRPDIDLIDWDVKERLYISRINYYLTRDEGRIVQRAVQNTRQRDASALLEESNVRVLNALKKGLERACRGYLYEWNEPEVRRSYTESQMQVYRPWIGTLVQDLEIRFEANEWEQERMIMHCYVEVAFRDIIKRIILEINIRRPDYSGNGGEE